MPWTVGETKNKKAKKFDQEEEVRRSSRKKKKKKQQKKKKQKKKKKKKKKKKTLKWPSPLFPVFVPWDACFLSEKCVPHPRRDGVWRCSTVRSIHW